MRGSVLSMSSDDLSAHFDLAVETFTFDELDERSATDTTDLASVQAKARERLAKLVPLAIDTLSQLATGAERENVQLAAAESILDRTGLARGANISVTTTKQEHDQATEAALVLVKRLEKNQLMRKTPVLAGTPDLETLVVLEGDDITLPQEGSVPGVVIETTATEI